MFNSHKKHMAFEHDDRKPHELMWFLIAAGDAGFLPPPEWRCLICFPLKNRVQGPCLHFAYKNRIWGDYCDFPYEKQGVWAHRRKLPYEQTGFSGYGNN